MEPTIPNYSYSIQTIILKHIYFFDNVHLMKNVRNNLFNAKTFVFPSFTFNVQGIVINSPDGYIYHGQICIRFMTKIQNY